MHGLAKDYAGRVDCKVVRHDEGDSQARILRYGLDKHGMVLTDGADRVLWSESGHQQTRERTAKALDDALARPR